MFSIIMPVWNRAGFIERAIESVIKQNYKEYELLIVDDGSEDNLEEIVKPFLNDKIIYHRIEHSGVCAARNYALQKAKYPYIAYLDSDNTWHPDYLEKMFKVLNDDNKKKHVAYCMANRYEKNPSTGQYERHGTVCKEFNFFKLMEANFIDLNTFVHSRDVLKYTGLFDENLKRLVDWEFIIRVILLYEPVFIRESLVDYYNSVADNSITLSEDFETANNYIKQKHSGLRKRLTIRHEGILYKWDNVSDKKYLNWLRVNQPIFNTDEYTSWGYPFMLQIEPTNTCNLECTLCPVGRNELNRKAKHMKLDEFKRIIDDMKDYLLMLILWDWGEPFMNPEFPEMIKYATQCGIKTMTSTNAHFLNNSEYVERILTSGLTTLIVAFDSINNKNYELYRKRGDLKNVVRIKEQVGSDTIINLRTVVMKTNEHELEKIKKFAYKAGVDRYTLKTCNPGCQDDSMETDMLPDNPKYNRFEFKPGTREPIRIDQECPRPWRMTNIFSNGDVVPCCYYYDAKIKLGNVNEKLLSEMWNQESFRNFRKLLYHNKEALERCNYCYINFKMPENGWIPETTDLKECPLPTLKQGIKNKLRPTPIWPVLRYGKRTVVSGLKSLKKNEP